MDWAISAARHRSRFLLDGEVAACRLRAEKAGGEKVSVDGGRRVLRKRRDLHEAEYLSRRLDEMEVEVVPVVHADAGKTGLVCGERLDARLLADFNKKPFVVFHRLHLICILFEFRFCLACAWHVSRHKP